MHFTYANLAKQVNLLEMVKKVHKTRHNKIVELVKRKMRYLYSNMKQRSKREGVKFAVSNDQLFSLLDFYYGKECTYCKTVLTYKNMVCDHINPVVLGGESKISNLQFICKSCNTRKGPLLEEEFLLLLQLIESLSRRSKEHILRKLAKGGKF